MARTNLGDEIRIFSKNGEIEVRVIEGIVLEVDDNGFPKTMDVKRTGMYSGGEVRLDDEIASYIQQMNPGEVHLIKTISYNKSNF